MQLFVYFYLFIIIIILLEFQASCVHAYIYIYYFYYIIYIILLYIYIYNLIIMTSSSISLVLNTILEEKKGYTKRKRKQKRGRNWCLFPSADYSPLFWLYIPFLLLSSPLNGNWGRVELSIKLLTGFYSRMSIFRQLESICYTTKIFTYNSCN